MVSLSHTLSHPTPPLSVSIATAETVITADEGVRGGRTIPLKGTVDTALKESPCVKRVLVATRTGAAVPMVAGRDHRLEELMKEESTECPPVPMDSEDPLFMLYTSGSTGKPKGILHTQAGYILYTGLTQQVWGEGGREGEREGRGEKEGKRKEERRKRGGREGE